MGTKPFGGEKECRILILNEQGVYTGDVEYADTVICPSEVSVLHKLKCNRVITCGMDSKSTLSFSCLNNGKAMLSVSRTVNGIEPCEVYINIKEELSLYENLVVQALRILKL